MASPTESMRASAGSMINTRDLTNIPVPREGHGMEYTCGPTPCPDRRPSSAPAKGRTPNGRDG
eukprot:1948437-Lingulodinium_polyedra.AAC.1